ncbi:MAG: hypothetical protein SVE93_06110 [Candidatus Thermoplasmatota archaeon]|nr:hypothetical protein [Candidatus Thermoplasmatota archaeon]
MALEDYLFLGEEITYKSTPYVKYQDGQSYEVILTNKRLLLYKTKGFSFLKKENIISKKIGEIEDVKYRDKGILPKKGVIEVICGKNSFSFEGDANSMKTLFKRFQELL